MRFNFFIRRFGNSINQKVGYFKVLFELLRLSLVKRNSCKIPSTTANQTDSFHAVALLCKMFQVEEIGSKDTPKTVWERYYVSKPYKLNNF